MKKKAALLGLHGLVRVNNAGCLDACEHGIAMVVYPEQIWYRAVSLEDIDDILKKHIVGGEIVQRCLMDPRPGLPRLPVIHPKTISKEKA